MHSKVFPAKGVRQQNPGTNRKHQINLKLPVIFFARIQTGTVQSGADQNNADNLVRNQKSRNNVIIPAERYICPASFIISIPYSQILPVLALMFPSHVCVQHAQGGIELATHRLPNDSSYLLSHITQAI